MARDVLDRAGYKPTDKVELAADVNVRAGVTVALAEVLTMEQLLELRKRAQVDEPAA